MEVGLCNLGTLACFGFSVKVSVEIDKWIKVKQRLTCDFAHNEQKISNYTIIFQTKIWRTQVLFVRSMILMFWIFGVICPGFQNQDGSLACILSRRHAMDSSDSSHKRISRTIYIETCPSKLVCGVSASSAVNCSSTNVHI